MLQFLRRKRRLATGELSTEKWEAVDQTLHKLDQKLRDAGRPDQGTKKVSFVREKRTTDHAVRCFTKHLALLNTVRYNTPPSYNLSL